VVDALLAEELIIITGGLQVCDTNAGIAVMPGCCAGLEDWRDWAQVFTGDSPFLGHDPGPEVEAVCDDLRVWQDGGPNRHRGRWAGVHVDMPRRALPDLLMGVQRNLVGFLDVLAVWTERAGLGGEGPRWWSRSTRTSPLQRRWTYRLTIEVVGVHAWPCGR
jgi:hypothetical protein